MGHTDRYTDCKQNKAQLPQDLGKHTQTHTIHIENEAGEKNSIETFN